MFKSLVTEVLGVGVDPEQQGASLKDYEWRSRVLIIFSDEEGTEQAGRRACFLPGPMRCASAISWFWKSPAASFAASMVPPMS